MWWSQFLLISTDQATKIFLMAGQSLKQYEVGVVGHLLVRTNFKEDLIDCRWLHFVDNSKRCPR